MLAQPTNAIVTPQIWKQLQSSLFFLYIWTNATAISLETKSGNKCTVPSETTALFPLKQLHRHIPGSRTIFYNFTILKALLAQPQGSNGLLSLFTG
jgi:hypothetical protein